MGTLTSTNEHQRDPGEPRAPGERLFVIRTSAGLSQQAFADALGISLRAEQNYERGSRKLPAELLLTLARRFGVDPLWVLEGPEPDMQPLASARAIDHDVLVRAIKIVRGAVVHAERDVSDQDFAYWVVAVYRFLNQNPGGRGADELVGRLIRGAAD